MNRPKQALAVLAVGLLIASAAACADDPQTSPGLAAPAGVAATAKPEFPATVATIYGDITVEKQPNRVLALGFGDADTLRC